MAAPLYGGDEVNALVIDIGAYQCKAGYAGEDCPKLVCSTAVGEVPEEHRGAQAMDVDVASTSGQENSAAQPTSSNANGQQAQWRKRGLHVLRGPHTRPLDHQEVVASVQNGTIADWDAWECVVHEAICDGLRANFADHPMLMTESSAVSKDCREKVTERMFESNRVPALFLAKNAVLSSFALGRQTSLVLDVGYDGTIAAAVHDGYVLDNSVVRSPLGGRLLDEYLAASLRAKDFNLAPWYMASRTATATTAPAAAGGAENVTKSHLAWASQFVVADCKESMCRISESPFVEEDNVNMPLQQYELPDGSQIDIGTDRFKVPEILFNPAALRQVPELRSVTSAGGKDLTSVAEMVIESVNSTDVDIRKELFSGIVITGGSSLFTGMKDRFDKELLEIAPQAAKIKSQVHPSAMERKYSAWLGGSILGCLGSFHQMWMSKQEYEEHGAALIHRKSP